MNHNIATNYTWNTQQWGTNRELLEESWLVSYSCLCTLDRPNFRRRSIQPTEMKENKPRQLYERGRGSDNGTW